MPVCVADIDDINGQRIGSRFHFLFSFPLEEAVSSREHQLLRQRDVFVKGVVIVLLAQMCKVTSEQANAGELYGVLMG